MKSNLQENSTWETEKHTSLIHTMQPTYTKVKVKFTAASIGAL